MEDPLIGASEYDRLIDDEVLDLIRRVEYLGENTSYSYRYDQCLRSILGSLRVCREEIATATKGSD